MTRLRGMSKSRVRPEGFPPASREGGSSIAEFVTGPLAEIPSRLSRPLTNELLDLRTARRGDYRVLFTLDVEDRILYVYRIEHSADVYKPR